MALITLNIGKAVVSESARAPGYKVSKVNGASALVINSDHKAAVATCVGNARKAKRLASSALKKAVRAKGIHSRVDRAKDAAIKKKMREQVKVLKSAASSEAKEAKDLLRQGAAALKAAGLSGLSSALKATDISLNANPERSLKTVTAAAVDSLTVSGKRTAFKPKFAKATAMEKSPVKKAVKSVVKTAVKETGTAKKFGNLFQAATTVQFGKKYAQQYWNFRRVGNKIVLDNPEQSIAGTITSAMAERHGLTLDDVEKEMRRNKMVEAKPKRKKRVARPLTQYNA